MFFTIAEAMDDMRQSDRQSKAKEIKAEKESSKLEHMWLRLLVIVAQELWSKVQKASKWWKLKQSYQRLQKLSKEDFDTCQGWWICYLQRRNEPFEANKRSIGKA